jgi:uncharacterized protein YbaR (Trm112 family)/SAM-dependent methyltransferase
VTINQDLSFTENWLDVIGCPVCQNSLHFVNGNGPALVCRTCGNQYSIQNGTPVLVPEEDLEVLTEFNQEYQKMRLGEGWRPVTAEQYLRLPYSQPPGYPAIYWEARRQSYTALRKWLSEQGLRPSMGPVADLGAGNGWLSCNLARSGYRVVALDSNVDKLFGLGAAKTYLAHPDIFIVQGDLDQPALQSRKFSMVIFNASLHYARDLASAIRRAERALRQQGRIVIMDSPITKTPNPGSGIGERQIGRYELDDILLATGLRGQWIPVQRGARWWISQVLRRVGGNRPISFPILIAEREVVAPEIKLS